MKPRLSPSTDVLWLASVVFFSGMALAGNPEENAEEISFEEEQAVEVVVTAERASEPQHEAASSISRLDGETIERRGLSSAVDILQSVPGVDAQEMSPGGFGGNVSIRGSSDFKPGGFGNRVLVLWDGVPLNMPDTDGVDWSALPLFDLKQMEVLRGPASALYGSAASGGVVQLISKPFADEYGLRFGQGFAGWDANRTRLALAYSSAGEAAGARLAGAWQKYAGLKAGGDDDFRYNSQSENWGACARAAWRPKRKHRLEASGFVSGSEGGNPGFEGTSERSRSRRFDRWQALGAMRWHYLPADGSSAEALAYFSSFGQAVADPGGENPNRYSSWRLGLKGQYRTLIFGRSVFTQGLEAQLDSVGGTVFQLGQKEDGRTYRDLTGAGFFQAQVDIGAGWEASAGFRLDGLAYDTGQRFFAFNPKARLAYRPERETVLWLAGGRGFRAPSIGELYLAYETAFGLVLQGNPHLRPESLWALEAGARRNFFKGRLSVELLGFVNFGEDTIEFVYSSPVSAQNLESSRMAGMEFSAQARPFRFWEFALSLSTLEALSYPGGEPMLYRPAVRASGESRLRIGPFELQVFCQAAASRLYDDFLDQSSAWVDPRTGWLRFARRRLSPWLLLDAALLWKTEFAEFSLQARNLLDWRLYAIQGYPAPGREWFLEAKFSNW